MADARNKHSQQKLVSVICEEHGQTLIPVYCGDCKRPICLKCVTTSHKGHSLVDIADIADGLKSALESLIEDKGHILKHLDSLNSRADDVLGGCKSHTERVIGEISDRADKIIQEVLEWKSELVQKVRKLSKECESELMDTKSVIEAVLQEFDCLQDSEYRHSLSDIQIAQVNYKLDDVQKAKVEDMPYNSGFPFSFSSSDYSPDVIRSDIFGKLVDENETSSDFQEVKREIGNVSKDIEGGGSTAQRQYKSNEQTCEKESKMTQESIIAYIFKRRSREYKDIRDIIPVHGSEFYILFGWDLYKADVKLDNSKLEPLMFNVNQIAGTPKGTVLVIKENSNAVMHILTDGKIVTFCQSSTMKAYSVCRSHKAFAILAFWKKTEDDTLCSIAEYNDTGIITRKVFSLYHSISTRDYNKLCHTKTDRLILFGKKIVDIRNMKCNLYWRYQGSIGPAPSEDFEAAGVCIDDENRLLVAAPPDNAIHLLDEKGNFLRLVLSEVDGVEEPYSVALDKSGYLWVGCRNGKTMCAHYLTLLAR